MATTATETKHDAADSAQATAPPKAGSAWVRLEFGGLVGALVLIWLSLTPSLLPRDALFQGVVTGAAAAVGYGLGVLVAAIIRWMLHREQPRPARALTWWVLAGIAVAGTVLMLIWFAGWQDELRTLMGVSGLSIWSCPIILVVAVVVFAILVALTRAVIAVTRWVARLLTKVLPARVAVVAGGVLVAIALVAVLDGVVANGAMSVLNNTFAAVNQETDADNPAPTVPERSGGPGSLVTWDSLGRQGRIFVGNGPTVEQLTEFNGRPAMMPIRTYTGLASAETVRAEAELAVAELDRAGGFDRAVIGVATTTGTGWINQSTASALEYLYNGDTALVSMQYSYLPSWLSFLVDQERARQAGQALFEAVYAKWSTLPENDRPKLVVFGESLGSFGGEAAFSGIQDLTARTDGALFVGPTSNNVVWGEVTSRRDPGTPHVLPVFQDGRTVRFVARPADLERPTPDWPGPRVVYLQHGSDPITWWTPGLALREPDWLREPRADDVLDSTRWIPIVTFLQVSADMAVSTNVPDGYGHTFHAAIADSWAAILQPPDWTPADTERLRAVLTGAN
ncbi:alpha/beta hydrolase [Nocardia cyriacigeorgica]|uniref:alpha/beta hydrolase n=1 Tax=Nocardia cyriacigeorgica TaxID=135487 RepID=UPI00189305B5|nr:alpha/beta-hydrolase family protein [Nocardia cyriacigeorgica]MBF6287588.1 alpha/beta-hydrolase family protein [Nocardia cyriacigeorgica]